MARHSHQQVESGLKKSYFNPKELPLFVAVSYVYVFLTEFSVHIRDLFKPNWFIKHLTFHILTATIGISVAVFLLGIALQRWKLG